MLHFRLRMGRGLIPKKPLQTQALLTRSQFIRVIKGTISFQTLWKWGSWSATLSIHNLSWCKATWIGIICSFPSLHNKLERLLSFWQVTSFPLWFPQVQASNSNSRQCLQNSKCKVILKSIRIVSLCLQSKLYTRRHPRRCSNLKRKIRAT